MTDNRQSGSGWSTGKILAVVIPVCVVVAAVAVTLVLVLGKSNKSTTPSSSPSTKTPTQEQVVSSYEQIKADTQTAVQQLAALESQEKMADANAYSQSVEQANATINQLSSDVTAASASVEQAAADVSTAAGEATETQQEYQALLTDIEAYYAYVADLTKQAEEQVQYVKSTLPTLEEVDQMKSTVTNIQQASSPVQQRTLSTQLATRASGIATRLKSAKAAPPTLNQFGAGLESLSGQLTGLSQQMSQALASGNTAGFNDLVNQMNAAISGTFGQLSSGITSTVGSFSSQLSSLGQKVDASIPKK